MFQFTRFAFYTYVFSVKYFKRSGLPHSEIHGSKGVGAYPWLIAACYVLHRLSMPRHPSYALRHLIFKRAEKKFAYFSTHLMKLIFSFLLSINLVGYIFTIYKNNLLTEIRKTFYMVGRGRFELPTSRLSSARSNQLSYRPRSLIWWRWSGSNWRPPACKAGALPTELHPHYLHNIRFKSITKKEKTWFSLTYFFIYKKGLVGDESTQYI